MISRLRPPAFLLLLVLAGSTSCRTAPREVSVRPGVNEGYFKEPQVEGWIKRFEAEDREIYAKRREIAAMVGVMPGMVVADVGAGTGIFTLLFAEAAGPRGRVYAVDIMPGFLEHIRKQADAAGLANVKTVLAREDSVELPRSSVDLAFVCDTYHHFEYPQSTLASIRRALRPAGQMVVVDFIREEGTSSRWVMDHVRAGKEAVIAEVREAGFELVEEVRSRHLRENYFLRFRRVDPPR
jgi:ubiquinone/menaquinone biosynthesis C-methylase UbiE